MQRFLLKRILSSKLKFECHFSLCEVIKNGGTSGGIDGERLKRVKGGEEKEVYDMLQRLY